MSFGEKDKIITIRLNPFEQKQLDYLLKHYYTFSTARVSEVIKSLIEKCYYDLKSKEK